MVIFRICKRSLSFVVAPIVLQLNKGCQTYARQPVCYLLFSLRDYFLPLELFLYCEYYIGLWKCFKLCV